MLGLPLSIRGKGERAAAVSGRGGRFRSPPIGGERGFRWRDGGTGAEALFADKRTTDGEWKTRVRAPDRDEGNRVDGGEGGGDGERVRVSGKADGTTGDGRDRARHPSHRRDRGTGTAASEGTAHGNVERGPQTEEGTATTHGTAFPLGGRDRGHGHGRDCGTATTQQGARLRRVPFRGPWRGGAAADPQTTINHHNITAQHK